METKQEAKLRMQLQCPMPKLDFEIVTLGHGSGGLLTNKLLDSGVFELLSNDWLDQRHDGAHGRGLGDFDIRHGLSSRCKWTGRGTRGNGR